LFHRDLDADSGAFVAKVGQGWEPAGGGPVQGGQGMQAGGGDVMDRSGLGRRWEAACDRRLEP
jgi:hypothetical protein